MLEFDCPAQMPLSMSNVCAGNTHKLRQCPAYRDHDVVIFGFRLKFTASMLAVVWFYTTSTVITKAVINEYVHVLLCL